MLGTQADKTRAEKELAHVIVTPALIYTNCVGFKIYLLCNHTHTHTSWSHHLYSNTHTTIIMIV